LPYSANRHTAADTIQNAHGPATIAAPAGASGE